MVSTTEDMEAAVSNWSNLHQHLLELMLKPLPILDRLRFGSVCRSWRKAQTDTVYPPAPSLPLLVIRRFINNGRRIELLLFSLMEKRIYKPSVHHLFINLINNKFSSSGGWLLLIGHDDDIRIQFLLNPFTNKRIDLPKGEEPCFYHNCLFFSTPADPDGLLLIAAKSSKEFLLCRLNDQSCPRFLPLNLSGIGVVSNLIFCRGKLYALLRDRSLVVIDPLSSFSHHVTKAKMELEPTNTYSRRRLEYEYRYHTLFLVESCGEILMVEKESMYGVGISFEVYRADLSEAEVKWMETQELGDCSIFLSVGCSVSVCASETGCKANRIYYTPCNGDWKLSFESKEMMGAYVEFELGRNGLVIPSLPVCDGILGCEWLIFDFR